MPSSSYDKDYYAVLGIPKTASERDIRSAYHKMALRWHPDKNIGNQTEAERKFKEISAAYEVLSDPDKKANYDRFRFMTQSGDGTGYNNDGGRSPCQESVIIIRNFNGSDSGNFYVDGNGSFHFNGSVRISSMTNRGNMVFRTGSHSRSPSFQFQGNGASGRSVSKVVVIVNGKRVVTKTVVENGVTTVTVKENGVLKQKFVNGVAQATTSTSSRSRK